MYYVNLADNFKITEVSGTTRINSMYTNGTCYSPTSWLTYATKDEAVAFKEKYITEENTSLLNDVMNMYREIYNCCKTLEVLSIEINVFSLTFGEFMGNFIKNGCSTKYKGHSRVSDTSYIFNLFMTEFDVELSTTVKYFIRKFNSISK